MIRATLVLLFFCWQYAASAQSAYEVEPLPVIDPDAPVVEQFKIAYAAYQQGEADRQAGLNTRLSGKLLDYAQLAYELGEDVFPDRYSANRMNLAINYARASEQRRKYEEASDLYKESLTIAGRIMGEDSVRLVPLLVATAEANNKWSYNNVFKADEYRRAIKIVKAHYGDNSVEHAQILLTAAAQAYGKGHSAARDYYMLAAEILEKHPDQALPLANAYFGLGKVEMFNEDEGDAIERFQMALQTLETAPQNEDSQRLRLVTRAFLVQAHERRGEDNLATQHLAQINYDEAVTSGFQDGLIYRPNAVYPDAASRSGDEGTVYLSFRVNTQGSTEDISIVRTEGLGNYQRAFTESAIEMVERMRFAPKYVNGNAISYRYNYSWNFYQID